MNLFATSPCPRRAAQFVDSSRLNKLSLEALQISCVALRRHGFSDVPYRDTHVNHPVTRWVGNDLRNLVWTMTHADYLLLEAQTAGYKTNLKRIACEKIWTIMAQSSDIIAIVRHGEQPLSFQNSARNLEHAIDFTSIPCPNRAYRMYTCRRWLRESLYGRGTKRPTPSAPKFRAVVPPYWQRFQREFLDHDSIVSNVQ